MLSPTHIEKALKAAGALGGQMISTIDIAELFNDAMIKYGDGQFNTPAKVAALVSECMMESAYFRTTEEYAKDGRYAPYIGRTFIQITWQKNYLDFGIWCRKHDLVPTDDYFVVQPSRLSDVKFAAIGGVWYFTQVMFDGKPLTAFAENIDQVGKAVNLGNPYSAYVPNGHAAREAAYVAVLALGDEIVPDIPPKENVVRFSKTYETEYQEWRGGNFAPLTIKKLQSVPSYIRVTQGGLSYAPASAKTHAGIGAFDLNTDGMTKDQVWKLCRELWEVDIIPAPRGFNADSFQGRTIKNTNDGNEHLHCLDRDQYEHMHWEAQAQCNEIMAGGDGLLGNAHFYGPSKKYRNSWKNSAYNPANVREGGKYEVVSGTLQGLNLDRTPKKNTTRKKGYVVNAVKLVRRWGRWNAVTSKNTFYAVKDSKQTYLKKVVPPAPAPKETAK